MLTRWGTNEKADPHHPTQQANFETLNGDGEKVMAGS